MRRNGYYQSCMQRKDREGREGQEIGKERGGETGHEMRREGFEKGELLEVCVHMESFFVKELCSGIL